MDSPQPAHSRTFPFVLGAGCGCVSGLAIGVLALSIGGWYWLTAQQTADTNPLQELNVPDGKLTPEQTKGVVDGLAQTFLASTDNVGLVIALVRENTHNVYGYGTTARGSAKKPDGDTVFEIASVGKTFTATVFAEMCELGELQMEDPLEKFVPAGTKVPQWNNRSITLLDLATHSSGLPSLPPNFDFQDPLNPYKDYTAEQMFAGLGQTTLTRAPGAEYEYSNFGFGLLGYAIAKRAEKDFEQLVVQRLCEPLQMTSTRMTLDADQKARLATPHSDGKAVPVWEDTTMPGAGSFLSTANDLTRYMQAHWNIPADELSALQRALKQTTQKVRRGGASSESLGIGWHISSENALDIIWHNGGSGGSTSYVGFLPNQRVGVIVLSNSSSSVDEIGRPLLYLLAWH